MFAKSFKGTKRVLESYYPSPKKNNENSIYALKLTNVLFACF
jgi:hypothetical protein